MLRGSIRKIFQRFNSDTLKVGFKEKGNFDLYTKVGNFILTGTSQIIRATKFAFEYLRKGHFSFNLFFQYYVDMISC